MLRRTSGSTRTYTLIPYTTLVRSRRTAPAGPPARTGPGPRHRRPGSGPHAGRTRRTGPAHHLAHAARSFSPDGRHQHRQTLGLSGPGPPRRSEEHTSELQSLMRNSYSVFGLKTKKTINTL